MQRILVTGMSGTGKSTALAELALRGFRVVDTDDPGWKERRDGEEVWREDRIHDLLAADGEQPLYVSGCVSNQGRFYDRFDAVVLLSAPADVILSRIEARTTNTYGKHPAERVRVLADLDATEPRLRATCTHEIDATRPVDDVVEALIGIGRGDEPRSALTAARRALAAGDRPRAVVLVEGFSDRCAVEALAARRGRDLRAERISVVPIGGAQAIGTFLGLYGPRGLDVRLAGICDAGEEGDFRRGLERAGLGARLTRIDMERLGFFVCSADLEDELIRALGAARVEHVVDAEGELGSFRTLQKQQAWRDRSTEQQLRRFMGSGSGRKIRYARLLVDALDLTRVPRPLDQALAQV